MKSRHPLSVIPYYGGKAKMSSFIAERLDYSTSIFITLFGGGCRELLNKPPHLIEYYNEYDSGLSALMSTLSNQDTAQELIDRLYNETEPTKEQFEKARDLYERCKFDAEEQWRNKLKKYFLNHKVVDVREVNKLLDDLYVVAMAELEELELTEEELFKIGTSKVFDKFDEFIKTALDKKEQEQKQKQKQEQEQKDELEEFDNLFLTWVNLKRKKEKCGLYQYRNMTTENISDMDLALATYLTFTLSFSGIGRHYGKGKYRTDEAYKKHILNLYPCVERMKDVHVVQLDAMSFFKQELFEKSNLDFSNLILYEWLNNPDVMMFADPSYISPDDEEATLHNENENIHIDIDSIDTEAGETVSEAIEKAWKGKKMPKNLGESYSRSFGYMEQEAFLKGIQNAKCKFMVCNYNLELYDKYLTPEKGWYKETFATTTTVSNGQSETKSNKRLEVIWRNY